MATKVSAFNTSGTNQRATTVVGLAFRSSTDGELYVVEGDQTGGIPVSIVSGAGSVTDVNLFRVAGAAALVDYGTPTVNAQRVVANISVAGAAVAAGNPVPITPGTGAVFTVTGALTDTQLRATPVPVSVSGVATEAKQDAGITALSGISTKLDSQATATKQDSIISGLASLVSQTDTVEAILTTIAGQTDAVESSLASLVTQTDAVETSLACLDTKTPALESGRQPVASRTQDGSGNAVTSTVTGTARGLDVNIVGQTAISSSGNLTAAGQSITLLGTAGYGSIGVVITGTWNGSLVVEGSIDGTTWFTKQIIPAGGGARVNNLNSNGSYFTVGAANDRVRVRANTLTSGTATVFIDAATPGNVVRVFNTNAENMLTTSYVTFAGVAASTGSGVTGTGVQRVTLSTDSLPTAGIAAVQLVSTTQRPYFQDFSLSSLTTTYVQIIASTPSVINLFCATNNSDTPIWIGTGAAASEVGQYLVMPGENAMNVPLLIAAGTRLAIRTQSGSLTSGQFSLNVF